MSLLDVNEDKKLTVSCSSAVKSVVQSRTSLKLSLLSASCLFFALPSAAFAACDVNGGSVVCTGTTTGPSSETEAVIGTGENDTTTHNVSIAEGATVGAPGTVISMGSGTADNPNVITVDGAISSDGQLGNGPMGIGGNAIEFISNTNVNISDTGSVIIGKGTDEAHSEAINPTGDNNFITNHGTVQTSNQSAAIWFEGDAGQGRNTIDNYGTIRAGEQGQLQVIGSSVGSVDLINRDGANIYGDVTLVDGEQNNVTLYNNSTLAGDLYGGGENAVLNLTGDSGTDTLPDGSDPAVKGKIYGFGSLNKDGEGTWIVGSANTDIADFNYDPYTEATKDFAMNVNAGTLVLAGDTGTQNTQNKVTATINGGVLQLGNGGTSGWIDEIGEDNGTLAFNRSDDKTFGAAIDGTGGIHQMGQGTITLTGDKGFTGTTEIDADSTLQLGDGTTDGTINNSSNIVDNGTLLVNNQNDTTISQVISGSGGLTQQGAGTTILTNANTYTGDTEIAENSTLQLGDGTTDGTINNTSSIDDNGTLAVNNQNETILHEITGTGNLQQNGTGTTVLLGDNDYEGTTEINQGTLQLGDGTTQGDLTNTSSIVDNATLAINNPDETTVKQQITGTGGLVQKGAGTAILTAENTYTGTTEIGPNSSLQLGNGKTQGSINNTSGITDNGTLIVNNPNQTVLGTAISGTGGLIQQGVGNTVLTAENTYTGSTEIGQESTLQLGDGTTQGSIANSSSITDNGTLLVDNPNDTVISQPISGTGGLTQQGEGTVILTNANTYTGATEIDLNSKLQLGDGTTDGSINNSSSITDNGTLSINNQNASSLHDITGSGNLSQDGTGTTTLLGDNTYKGETDINNGTLQLGDGTTQGNLSGTSAIVNNSTLAINNPEQTTIGQVISGTGNLSQAGAGTVALTNENTYTGSTNIGENSTLQLGDGTTQGTIANTSEIVDNGTLAVNNPQDTNITQVISGTGGLTQQGEGTTILTNANTYTGATEIAQGTLQLGDGTTDGSINNSSSIVDNGTLAVNNQNASTLNNLTGTGNLVQQGTGPTTLLGDNSYSGTTTIEQGTLQLGDGATQGTITNSSAIVNNGNFAIDNPEETVISQEISGTGNVSQIGAGTTTLTNANTYTGATEITQGTLQLGDGTTQGTIANTSEIVDNGTLAINNPQDTSITQAISGTGGLTQKGEGTTILSNANTYTGATEISQGTLQLGDGTTDGSIANSSSVVDNGTLAINNLGDTALSQQISGTGNLVQQGTGTTTLAGTNTYSNGTIITAGTLIGSANSFGSGAITDNAALVLNQETNADFDNGINGTGTFEKTGAGMVAINGENGLSGPTTISQGGLDVEGSLANSAVTAKNSTTLAGSGTVGSVTAESGSTVRPGSSGGSQIGTLNVNGDFDQKAGSTYVTKVVPNDSEGGVSNQLLKASTPLNESDLINVSGKANIENGAALEVHKASDGYYTTNTKYRVLTAEGGVTGTYDVGGDLTAFYTLQATYDPNNVYLEVLQQRSFRQAGITRNQIATAEALDSMPSGTEISRAVGSVDNDVEARQAFDALSGEIHASVKTALIEDSYYTRDAVIDRLRAADCSQGAGSSMKVHHVRGQNNKRDENEACEGSGPALWMQAYGSWGSNSGNGNAARLHHSSGGFVMGADTPFGDSNWHVGAMFGYGYTGFDVSGRRSNGHSNNVTVGAYTGTHWGRLGLRLGASYTWNIMNMGRTAQFQGYSRRLNSGYNGGTAQAFGDLGYRINLNKTTELEPFANVAYVNLNTDSYTEHGDRNSALHGSSQNTGVTYSTFGFRLSSKFNAGQAILIPNLTMGYRHAFGRLTPTADQYFLAGGNGFTVAGVPLAEDTALVDVGLKAKITHNMTAGLSYVGQYGSSYKDSGLRGNFSWKF